MLESSKIGSNVKDEYRPWLLFMSAIAHSAADDIPTALTQADQVLELIEFSALTGGIEMRTVSEPSQFHRSKIRFDNRGILDLLFWRQSGQFKNFR